MPPQKHWRRQTRAGGHVFPVLGLPFPFAQYEFHIRGTHFASMTQSAPWQMFYLPHSLPLQEGRLSALEAVNKDRRVYTCRDKRERYYIYWHQQRKSNKIKNSLLLFVVNIFLSIETRKASCRWQTRATLAKSLHGLRKSSGVVSCIASLPIDSLPMVSY